MWVIITSLLFHYQKSRQLLHCEKTCLDVVLKIPFCKLLFVCLTTDWTTGVRSRTQAEDFSSSLCVQTGSGAHPASCPMGTGGSFAGGKARPGRDADHSPPSSAEVRFVGTIPPLAHAPPWRVAGQLYFTIICTALCDTDRVRYRSSENSQLFYRSTSQKRLRTTVL
jgi:hypothetical protein